MEYQIKETIQKYNKDRNYEDRELNVVVFDEVVEHVTRIKRALDQKRGNALVLGTEGVGKKSLCRLSAYLANIPVHEISAHSTYNMTSWNQDMKSVFMTAGI